MRELTHVTLTTGHSRRSPRSEVDDDIVEAFKPIVSGGGGEINGLHVRIETPHTFTLSGRAGSPAVRCWLTTTADADPRLWATAGGDGPEPTAPWLAVRILVDALKCTPDEMIMLGDAERCVAGYHRKPAGSLVADEPRSLIGASRSVSSRNARLERG